MTTVFASVCYCIVGSNIGSPDKDALHVLECDSETGAAKIVQSVKGIEGTTYFEISPQGRVLWSAIRETSLGGEKRTWAVSFELSGNRIGKMTKVVELKCETPCHVALAPKYALPSYASYSSGTYSVLSLCSTPSRMVQSHAVLPDDAVGPRKDRQKKAYAHQTFYTPDGLLMGVCDLGCDRVNFYGGVPSAEGGRDLGKCVVSLKADPGDGPRHAIFSKCGRYLFVLNELSSSVTGYAYEGGGKFRRTGKWSAVPEGTDPLSTKAAAIKLTADGKVLMASNRGLDSIAFFEVKDDGTLEFRNLAMLKGRFPRDFELMPGEKFMVVGHKLSNEIQIYRFDRAKYALEPVGDAVKCFAPLCFKFMRVPPFPETNLLKQVFLFRD